MKADKIAKAFKKIKMKDRNKGECPKNLCCENYRFWHGRATSLCDEMLKYFKENQKLRRRLADVKNLEKVVNLLKPIFKE